MNKDFIINKILGDLAESICHYTKASEWYKKACQNGNSHGCENYKKLHN